MNMQISVIIPIYNEQGNIKQVTQSVLDILVSMDKSWELLLVDDGSCDGTYAELMKLGYSKGITVVRHTKNLGKSRALKTGFDLAKGDVIITLDADGQHNPAHIPRFLDDLCTGVDVVVAKRMNRANSLIRNSMSRTYNWFLRTTMELPYSDFNSGYMAFKRDCLDKIGFTQQEIDRYNGLHRYLIPLALINGYKIIEVPVEHLPRMHGKSFIRFEEHFLPIVRDYALFMKEHYKELQYSKRTAFTLTKNSHHI